MNLFLKKMTIEDTKACLELFKHTIIHVNSKDYDDIQIQAWINPQRKFEDWQTSFENRHAYVVLDQDKIVGFIDMNDDGYLDRLYVHYQYQNCGIGKLLVNQVEKNAIENKISEIETHASITAKPFFEHLNYQVICRQTVNCRGVLMDNYVMKKKL